MAIAFELPELEVDGSLTGCCIGVIALDSPGFPCDASLLPLPVLLLLFIKIIAVILIASNKIVATATLIQRSETTLAFSVLRYNSSLSGKTIVSGCNFVC